MIFHPVRKYSLAPLPLILAVCFLLTACLLLLQCKQAYEPPAITATNNYLVVDGIINTGTGAVTSIHVNRTRNLNDSTPGGIPELHAAVTIVAGSGATYTLQDTANAGVYTSGPLTLPITQSYKIAITTHDGRKYASDLVPVKQTPLMDSAYYEEPGDFNVYVDTHDPSGNTIYYRWDYVETWEHDAQLMSPWVVQNGLIVPTDSTNQHTQCWTTVNSTNILLGSSLKLSQDVISRAPIIDIPNGDPRINQKYSILVRQYALTAGAYAYWSLIRKTSQQLGSLFDLQPTRLTGNIHCLTNPGEPVIGYMSASSVQQQRIFVFQSDLHNWNHNQLVYGCDTMAVPVNQTDYRIYSETDTIWAPYYFVTGGPLVLATRICVDCTLFGGNNIKPSYWK